MRKKSIVLTLIITLGCSLTFAFFVGTNVVITKQEKDRSVVQVDLNKNKKILFYKDDCQDCQQVFHQYYWHAFFHKDVLFVNLNQEKNQQYIAQYHLKSVPTVMFKKDSYAGTSSKKIEQFLSQK